MIVFILTAFFHANIYNLLLNEFANPVIILFFSSFILAQAINKYEIGEYFLQKVIGNFGKTSLLLIACFIIVSAFLSMWISNTTSAAVSVGLAQPFFRLEGIHKNFKKVFNLRNCLCL
jgi:sodium-dependent dicarboxylate transporter 2/3/5